MAISLGILTQHFQTNPPVVAPEEVGSPFFLRQGLGSNQDGGRSMCHGGGHGTRKNPARWKRIWVVDILCCRLCVYCIMLYIYMYIYAFYISICHEFTYVYIYIHMHIHIGIYIYDIHTFRNLEEQRVKYPWVVLLPPEKQPIHWAWPFT